MRRTKSSLLKELRPVLIGSITGAFVAIPLWAAGAHCAFACAVGLLVLYFFVRWPVP